MAGVMGWPVMHSRSPLMHNHWFAQEKLKGVYVPLAIQPDNLEAALRSLQHLGFSGCNLTIPHKQQALKIVDEIDPIAQKMGAISCVAVKEDGRLVGSNNDAAGFIRNIKEFQPNWRADQGPVVVIGAGGGSQGCLSGLDSRRRHRNSLGKQASGKSSNHPIRTGWTPTSACLVRSP